MDGDGQSNVMERGAPVCAWESLETGGDGHNLPEPGCAAAHLQAMRDDQLEVLRRQISVYTIITRQLTEMLMADQRQVPYTSHHMSFDSGLSRSPGRVNTRQRWTPSIKQLEILERLYVKGDGAKMDKHRIKEITAELSAHGAIQDTNVYNWFQNRKARAKRKQARAQDPSQADGVQGLDPEHLIDAGSKKPRMDVEGSVLINVDVVAG